MAQQIQRLLLSDSVYAALRASIVANDLKPGERLRESELAKEFGTSQAPVREALRRLEQEGLLESTPHRGAFVARLTQDDVTDVLTIRAVLEGMAIRRAVPKMTAGDLDSLAALIEAMREAARVADIATLVEKDILFHTTICKIAGSKLLLSIWSTINGKARLAIATADRFYQHNLLEIVDIHEPILKAMRQGDPDAAVEANTEHLHMVCNRMGTSSSGWEKEFRRLDADAEHLESKGLNHPNEL